MRFSPRVSRYSVGFLELSEWAVGLLIVLSILWRGGKSLEMTWLLGGVAAYVTILDALRKHEDKVDVPLPLWGTGILFILWTIVSYVFSTTQNYGLDEVIRTTAEVLLLFWAYRKVAAGPEEGMHSLLRITKLIAGSVLLACAVGIIVYIVQPVDRFVGTFFDFRFHTDYWPNAWAELLLLGMPLVLYHAFALKMDESKYLSGRVGLLVRSTLVGIVLGCFFLSYSRASVVALTGEVLLWWACILLYQKVSLSLQKMLPYAAMIFGVAVLVFFSVNALRDIRYDVQDLSDKVTFTASEGTSSISERSEFWKQALTLTVQKPLTGYGPYSFRFVQPELQTGVLRTSDHPHNLFLKMSAERGIPAAALLVLLLFFLGSNIVRYAHAKPGSEYFAPFGLPLFVLVGSAGVLSHNLVDYNLQFVGISLPFWVTMGALAGLTHGQKKHTLPLWTIWGEVFLSIVLCFILLTEGVFLVLSSVGRHAEARNDTVTAMRYFNLSSREWFSRDLELSKANVLIVAGRPGAARDVLESYRVRNSQDYRAPAMLARIAASPEEALQLYTEAYTKGKYNDLEILLGIIRTSTLLGHTDELAERKAADDRVVDAYYNAIMQNAHYIALSPNVEAFIALANILAELYPDEEALYVTKAARADHHAEAERARLQSRAPGFLW